MDYREDIRDQTTILKTFFCLKSQKIEKALEVRFCDDFEEKMIVARHIRSKYYPEENSNNREVVDQHV